MLKTMDINQNLCGVHLPLIMYLLLQVLLQEYIALCIYFSFILGKPKMFFIQACQGDQLDRGITLSRTETDGSPHSYRIPTHADFLIAYSTISGKLKREKEVHIQPHHLFL